MSTERRPFTREIRAYLDGLRDVVARVDEAELAACLEALWQAWQEDRTVFIVGNGGSAANASHMASDLSKQTQVPGRRPLRAHSLTDNMALVTALANDHDYTRVFAEQLRIHARPGDLLVCLSGSGASGNVVAAIEEALNAGLRVIGLGGFDGGRMRELCDVYVHVPARDYGMVESVHLLFDHCLASLLYDYGVAAAGPRPAVFVDRDGVIIRNRDDYVKSWAEVELIPGAIDALGLLSKAGYQLVVVTNQSAVGRGLITEKRLQRIHDRLAKLVEAQGGRIAAFMVCPHLPEDGCDCRKPAPGLLLRARDQLGLDLEASYMVGDAESDLAAAAAAGCRSVLVLTGMTSPASHGAAAAANVAAGLLDAARLILAAPGQPKATAPR